MKMHMDSRGRIVIPASVRRALGITERTLVHVRVNERGRRIILTPITREYVDCLRGKYRGKGLLKALMAEKKREREL